jgi:protein-L-isoaspartate(D-aspartate) O-methyltransferase
MVRVYLGGGISPAVARAMAVVPRHFFVPSELSSRAYDDVALPIGVQQTISQPRVVALMLTSLAVAPRMQVLDVGAGSGYATALLARLVHPGAVTAIERQHELIADAQAALSHVASHATLHHGDGLGDGPLPGPTVFDAIHVACACPELPAGLVARLAPGGRLVIPLGEHGQVQSLTLFSRAPDGAVTRRTLARVVFVPGLVGTSAAADAPGPRPSAQAAPG